MTPVGAERQRSHENSLGIAPDPERVVRSTGERRLDEAAGTRMSHGMTRYLISFNDGAMDHIPDDDWPDVGKASHTVVQDAVHAGVFVFGAGLERRGRAPWLGTGWSPIGPCPETKEVIGGFVVVDVASREEALTWAAKIADAGRCAQEVREPIPDPETDAMLRRADR
jgi:hypothetical protein